MARPKKKQSQLSPVGHTMIGDTLITPVLKCDLLAEIQDLHKEEAWLQGTGPSSKTLVKHPDLRIVLLAMRKKMFMREHKTQQGSPCRLSQDTFVLGYQIALWSYAPDSYPSSINAFCMMLKRKKTVLSCLRCRGSFNELMRASPMNGRKKVVPVRLRVGADLRVVGRSRSSIGSARRDDILSLAATAR